MQWAGAGNGGRAIGSFVPLAVGLVSDHLGLGLGAAMGLCACASYGMIVVAALLLPETRGRDLSTITMQGDLALSGGEQP